MPYMERDSKILKKRRKKREKCLILYLKLYTTLKTGTPTIQSDIIRFHSDTFNFPWK